MTENREQSRSLYSLATAEAMFDELLAEADARLIGQENHPPKGGPDRPPGMFLKNQASKADTAHSTVEKNNSARSEDKIVEKNNSQNSVLKNTLKMLEEISSE